MGKPFVLTLTPFDQPFFYLQVQRAIEAVLYDYYVDEQEYMDDPSTFASIKAKRLKVVRKNNGVELPLGVFNDVSHAHISAILFNSSATWGTVRSLSEDPYPFIQFSAGRLGLPSHPRDLSGLLVSFLAKKKHNQGGSMRLAQLNHETPSTHLAWEESKKPWRL
jgi:hypothetical protein